MLNNRPALQLVIQPTNAGGPQAITPAAALAALNKIVERLEIKPEKGQDPAELIMARIAAIKTERDQLRAKLDDFGREVGEKNYRSFKGEGREHEVVVAASRESSDAKVVESMINDKTAVAI